VDEASWGFRARYLAAPDGKLRTPRTELQDARPQLLVSLFAQPHFALGSAAAKALGSRTAFRVLPTFDAWIRRRKVKEAAKHALFRTVDAVKVPGPDGAQVARKYGVPADRIFRVTQSVDVEHYARRQDGPAATAARGLRHELPADGPVFLYVGRLWQGKGLEYLLAAFKEVVAQHPSASLVLIGDGVDEGHFRARAQGISNLRFAGFVQPADLPAYYHQADVLVFSTLGDPHGLVVEEGMAAGLPVICTTAAGDIRLRLPDGEAGLIVPPADAEALASAMLRLIRDPVASRRMGALGRELVSVRTHDRWAADFELFVDGVLSLPPRSGPATVVARALGRLAR
jgi:glycosyltransferase involved in cell wall biosynthesis